jgi:hypothetical protein
MMRAIRPFEIKWYHLQLGFLGILVVVLVVVLVLMRVRGRGLFVEDETDIVSN